MEAEGGGWGASAGVPVLRRLDQQVLIWESALKMREDTNKEQAKLSWWSSG